MTGLQDIGWIGLDGPVPQPDAHGEKAVLLAAAAAAGLPVPPGFVLRGAFNGDLSAPMAQLEAATGRRLGDPEAPLLVSVRPSGVISAGGVAPAILDIGICPAVMPHLAGLLGEHVAHDLCRRLIHSYGAGALGVDGEEFEYALHDALREAGVEAESDLNASQLAALSQASREMIEDMGTAPFPEDPHIQLEGAVAALRTAWASRRAQLRREALGVDPQAPLAISCLLYTSDAADE